MSVPITHATLGNVRGGTMSASEWWGRTKRDGFGIDMTYMNLKIRNFNYLLIWKK